MEELQAFAQERMSKRTVGILDGELGSCIMQEVVDVVWQKHLSARIVEPIGVILVPQIMEEIGEVARTLSQKRIPERTVDILQMYFSERSWEQTSDGPVSRAMKEVFEVMPSSCCRFRSGLCRWAK